MNKARAKAWKTRRKLYGARGHNGSYARSCPRCRRMITMLVPMITMLVRLHVDGVLSEGQVAKATGLHRIDVRKVADGITSSRETGSGASVFGADAAEVLIRGDHRTGGRQPVTPTAGLHIDGGRCGCTDCT